MGTEKLSTEEAFRDNLKDLLAFARKLGPLFDSVPDMVRIMELAVEDDAQLRLLLKLAAARK